MLVNKHGLMLKPHPPSSPTSKKADKHTNQYEALYHAKPLIGTFHGYKFAALLPGFPSSLFLHAHEY